MQDWYSSIRWLHIGLVFTSGALFAVRGVGVLCAADWSMHALVRRLSYGIDTLLLSAALLLLHILQLNPFAVPWLRVKLGLLLLYIVLGSFALKRAKTRGGRALCFAAALLCYSFMVTVARAHNPWGFL